VNFYKFVNVNQKSVHLITLFTMSTSPPPIAPLPHLLKFASLFAMRFVLFLVPALCLAETLIAQETMTPFTPVGCEILPLPDHQVSFLHDGIETIRWHFDPKYPRPFFYPFNGPSGISLTRMGHPGAQNHDHHRSIWFAHAKVDGIDFWSENTKARVRQKMWLAYEDGKKEAIMASQLGWFDEAGVERMEQDLVAASFPGQNGGHFLEIQLTLRPAAGRDAVALGKSNFGLLAVRVAKSISHHFGGGQLTNSEGLVGEEAIFGKRAAWMDYSGPVVVGTGPDRKIVTEGITFFDHPGNPRHPTAWHVRSDGWMGASFCMEEGYTITKDPPLVLRYLLYAHGEGCDPDEAAKSLANFEARPGFIVEKATRPHRQFEVRRVEKGPAR